MNELGAKSIKKHYTQNPETGDIKANQLVTLIYDGTNFQMQSQLGNENPRRSYFAGLGMSNDTDTAHDILIAVGEATDSTNSITLKLSTAITKQIDATWALGDDAGGMNDGDAVGNNEWFHVFLLATSAGGSVDVGYDTSLTAAGLLADTAVIAAGLTLYCRIGSVLTDGSANIVGFSQEGDEFLWDDPVQDVSATQATTAETRTLTVVTGIKVKAIVNIAHRDANDVPSATYLSPLDVNDGNPAITSGLVTNTAEIVNQAMGSGPYYIRTNTSGQIRSRGSHTLDNLYLTTLGWIDRRGKDD